MNVGPQRSSRWAAYALRPLLFLFSLYTALVWVLALFLGGALVLVLPGLALRRRVARRALRMMLFAGGTPYAFDHLERVPDGPCVVIANHQSYLDGLILIAALPPRFAPVIKAEMGQVPVIGTVLRRVGAYFVRREPAVTAGRDTLDLLDALQAGQSLALFPEGTFVVDRGLLPFRDGAFFLAAKAGVPVVPVGIRGASRVLPDGAVLPRPGVVTTGVLEPLSASGQSREAADELRARVEGLLLHGLQRATHPWRADTTPNYDFYCAAFAGQTLPFAFVDIDLLERHTRAIVDAGGGKRLRVDARVLRCPLVIERVMRSHPRFHGVKCSTVGEALYLSAYSEIDDFLVAYPLVQRQLVEQVCQALSSGRYLTLTVDSSVQLDMLDGVARKADVSLPLCVEIDISKRPGDGAGGRRSAIQDTDTLVTLANTIAEYPHLRFRGVLIFDIQSAAHDGNGRRLRERREHVVQQLRSHGHDPDLVDCAGAGSIRFNAGDPSITEITVGAAFLGLTDVYDNALEALTPAAGYAGEIMRHISPDLYATLGGGYTAPDTTDRALLPSVYLPAEAELDALNGAGAGQLPLRYAGKLSLGDMIFMHPANASELCERFDRLLLLQQGAIVGAAATYRAVGDQFLPSRSSSVAN